MLGLEAAFVDAKTFLGRFLSVEKGFRDAVILCFRPSIYLLRDAHGTERRCVALCVERRFICLRTIERSMP